MAAFRALCTPREFKLLCGMLFIALIGIRVNLWWVESIDVRDYFLPWLETIHAHGGWHALGEPIGQYFPIYLYLLTAASYLDRFLSPMGQIKIIPLIFDIYSAVMAYRIVALLEAEDGRDAKASVRPMIALLATFALPSLLLDGAAWGQIDSFYISFLMATVFYTIRYQPVRAAVCLGIAFCLKMQAIFLGPFLLVALLRGRFRWWHVFLVPLVWLASVAPVLLMGRSFASIFEVAAVQSSEFKSLGSNVANPWQLYHLLPLGYTFGLALGLLLTALAAGYLVYIGFRQQRLTASWLFFFATSTLLIMPYVMPKMHDRYFLPGQVCLVVLTCYSRRFLLPAALIEASLLLVYANFFRDWFGGPPADIAVLACTGGLFLMVRELIRSRTGSDAVGDEFTLSTASGS